MNYFIHVDMLEIVLLKFKNIKLSQSLTDLSYSLFYKCYILLEICEKVTKESWSLNFPT